MFVLSQSSVSYIYTGALAELFSVVVAQQKAPRLTGWICRTGSSVGRQRSQCWGTSPSRPGHQSHTNTALTPRPHGFGFG